VITKLWLLYKFKHTQNCLFFYNMPKCDHIYWSMLKIMWFNFHYDFFLKWFVAPINMYWVTIYIYIYIYICMYVCVCVHTHLNVFLLCKWKLKWLGISWLKATCKISLKPEHHSRLTSLESILLLYYLHSDLCLKYAEKHLCDHM
jgi:hypothetical protein